MAIITCPGCGRRISDKSSACTHCDLPLKELSESELERIEQRRMRRKIWRAKNITYLAMTALVAGAIWWMWVQMQNPEGQPPRLAMALIGIGILSYLGGRAWLFWLKVKRNRSRSR